MTFRQPLVHRWWQQKPRLAVYLAKVAHPPTATGIPSLQSYHIMRHLPPKSDRLLAHTFQAIAELICGFGRREIAGWTSFWNDGGSARGIREIHWVNLPVSLNQDCLS